MQLAFLKNRGVQLHPLHPSKEATDKYNNYGFFIADKASQGGMPDLPVLDLEVELPGSKKKGL